jgi:hypothetical protein
MESEDLRLSTTERNLYFYFKNHMEKKSHVPCFVPRCTLKNNRMNDYLDALDRLEKKQLVVVDRSSDNYTRWIMTSPRPKPQPQFKPAPKEYKVTPMNEYQHLSRILSELEEIVKRESKRHEMDMHLTPSMYSLLQEQIIPQIQNELDCDYESDELGEPPITMDEMHTAALKEHITMHS